MKSDNRNSSQHEERLDHRVVEAKGEAPAAKPARPRRAVNQVAIRRLFLGPAASPRRQAGKDAVRRESRTAIVVTTPKLLRTVLLTQTFSTPFNRP